MEESAVEWLEEELKANLKKVILEGDSELMESLFEQAKEMEKEQIVEAFFQGVDRESDGHGAMYLSRKDAEKYYKQTFKSE